MKALVLTNAPQRSVRLSPAAGFLSLRTSLFASSPCSPLYSSSCRGRFLTPRYFRSVVFIHRVCIVFTPLLFSSCLGCKTWLCVTDSVATKMTKRFRCVHNLAKQILTSTHPLVCTHGTTREPQNGFSGNFHVCEVHSNLLAHSAVG
jgi:hypothetical protein